MLPKVNEGRMEMRLLVILSSNKYSAHLYLSSRVIINNSRLKSSDNSIRLENRLNIDNKIRLEKYYINIITNK